MKILFKDSKDAAAVKLVDGEITQLKDGELHIGVKKLKDTNKRQFIKLCRKVIQEAKKNQIKKISVSLEDFLLPKLKNESREELVSLMAQNFEVANFEFHKFKKEPKEGWKDVTDVVISGKSDTKLQTAFKRGQTIGEEINKCRVLSNTPGGDMTPKLLAQEAKKAASGTKVSVKILSKKEIEKEKMGAILGVARGSDEDPQFIIMEYRGATNKKESPTVLVGKGVTFDTGGLNLKPTGGISDMHLDMSGGAAVIHAVVLASRLKLKKNVVGLIPAVENMPSGSSYRPGDILKSLSGKTIEIIDTDAEGRVILADALTYAKRYNPKLVVDVATLTGAALAALGEHAHAIMTKDEKLAERVGECGEEVGEYTWPLPMWDEYERYIPGTFGDVANLAVGTNPRYGGAINGGMFLYQFTKDYPKTTKWVHIDMAPRMIAAPGDNLSKGSTGEPVGLLVRMIERL